MNTSGKLSPAQVAALQKFAQPGGHGYGEFSFLPKPTARALERRGFVVLSYDRRMPIGRITPAGIVALANWRAS